MSKKAFNLKTWLQPKLRRLSYQWPSRKRVRIQARVARGKYTCNLCKGIYGPTEISLDHINPVVPVETGFTDWNSYIERLFCGDEGYQVLCDTCHDKKTLDENIIRKEVKKDLTIGTKNAKMLKRRKR